MIELLPFDFGLLELISLCVLGFFNTSSSSKQYVTDNRVATTVTDEAQLASDQGVIVNPGGVGVSGEGATLNFQDTEVVTRALDNMAALAMQFQDGLGQFGQSLSGVSRSGQDALADAMQEISHLSEQRLTDGESGRNKIVLYMVLAAFAVFGLIFWQRK